MSDSGNSAPAAPTWSLAGLSLGARLALPILPSMVAFALAVGATAARKGFSFVELVLMNGFVYAGASQIVAMEIWPDTLTFGAVAAIALVTATMNSRLLLMSASMRPWFAPLPSWQTYPMLHLNTDPGWLIVMRYRAEGGNDAAVFLGGGVIIFVMWMAGTSAGYLLGSLIADPRKYGIDLVMPVFFATLLIPLWHSAPRPSRRAIGWIVAGIVALAVERIFAGYWFIIAGAIAGAMAEGYADEH
jgi:predicted branched-subunit amino acid permease